jgi:hypothetical protein
MGPNTRVPTGSPDPSIITTALSEKDILSLDIPLALDLFTVRTITALWTFFQCLRALGVTFFAHTVIASPNLATDFPPGIPMHSTINIPVLSATVKRVPLITLIIDSINYTKDLSKLRLRANTSASLNRFVRDIGRQDSIRTLSPKTHLHSGS